MSTYLNRYSASFEGAFINRVRVAILDAAIDVIGEDVANARGDKRHALAMRVIANPGEQATIFAQAILAAAGASALAAAQATDAAGDTQLATLVTQGWDKLAGVRNGDA